MHVDRIVMREHSRVLAIVYVKMCLFDQFVKITNVFEECLLKLPSSVCDQSINTYQSGCGWEVWGGFICYARPGASIV